MARGGGVRISVSYHLPPDDPHDGVQLQPMDTYGTAEERTDVVEADTFELVKLLRRRGITVAVPAGVGRLAYEDTSANLSMLLHGGDRSVVLGERHLRRRKRSAKHGWRETMTALCRSTSAFCTPTGACGFRSPATSSICICS